MPGCKFCGRPVEAARVFHGGFCDRCALVHLVNLGV